MADYGHMKAALEGKEGAEKALEDFAAGITTNPFGSYEKDGSRGSAWRYKMEILINNRNCAEAGHDVHKCCQEHDRHLALANKVSKGLSSCRFCEEEVEKARGIIASEEEFGKK